MPTSTASTRLARTRPDLFAGDFAILGEPSNGAVEGGCNGNLRAIVRTHGVRSHSARAWVGENAIHKAAPVLSRLAEYRPREVDVDGLVYREGLNAVRVGGGVAGNVIPDLCEVEVNYRFAPSRVRARTPKATCGMSSPGSTSTSSTSRREHGRGWTLRSPRSSSPRSAAEARPKYGWTDVARFSAIGVPAVNYGPGDPHLAHHDEERVPLAQIDDVERGLRAWLSTP